MTRTNYTVTDTFLMMRILSAALLWMFLLNIHADSKDVSKNVGYV